MAASDDLKAKLIEELRSEAESYRQNSMGRSQELGLAKLLDNAAAIIERLRGTLEGIGQKEERIEEGTRKYIACGVCHRPIGRNTLFKNECPSDCLGNIARQAIDEGRGGMKWIL